MANETNQPGGWQPAKPLGTGESESPIVNQPQAPQVGIRTMNSDKSSITTGDTAPKTYAPQAPASSPSRGSSPAPAPSPVSSAPSAPSFSSQSFELPQIDMGSSPSITPPKPKKNNKGLFVALVTCIVIIGLAAIGYFVVYPMLAGSGSATPPVVSNIPPQPSNAAPQNPNQPAGAATTTPTSTEIVPTSTATTTSPASPVPATHVTPFKTALDGSITLQSAITGAGLGAVTLPSSSKNPGLTEITYKDGTGNFISFSDIMHTLFGADFASGALYNAFAATSTSGFIYTDAQGNKMLGIVAVANPSASLAAIKSGFAQAFEANQNLKNIFANDPGAQNAWKSGETNGIANRYITFANPGFSVNYGWVGSTLVISSSYDGFKAILGHLQ